MIKTAWRLTCNRAGIADLHFHDLRPECGSRLLEAGTSLHEVRDWLGHQNVGMIETYLSTTVSKLQEAARKYELSRLRCTSVAQTGENSPKPPSEPASAMAGKCLN